MVRLGLLLLLLILPVGAIRDRKPALGLSCGLLSHLLAHCSLPLAPLLAAHPIRRQTSPSPRLEARPCRRVRDGRESQEAMGVDRLDRGVGHPASEGEAAMKMFATKRLARTAAMCANEPHSGRAWRLFP